MDAWQRRGADGRRRSGDGGDAPPTGSRRGREPRDRVRMARTVAISRSREPSGIQEGFVSLWWVEAASYKDWRLIESVTPGTPVLACCGISMRKRWSGLKAHRKPTLSFAVFVHGEREDERSDYESVERP